MTPLVGPDKSRSLKKMGFYTVLFIGSMSAIGLAAIAAAIFYLAHSLVNSLPLLAPLNLPTGWKITILLALVYLPVIIWAIGRLWYKYVHLQEKVVLSESRNMELWEFMNTTHREVITSLGQKMVKDQGNYRDDTAGFSITDLQRVAEDTTRLKDLEESE